jgi:hypothetical protein
MRLLAYGGTGYYERQRIGAWENAPRDALDDSFRLEEDQLTFGLCLIEKEPVLVVRQLQVTRTGRAYAYSLLLDPGASVWHRFEWDAAALADSLFDEASEVSRLLLEQPEKLNAQDLQEVFKSLNPKEDRQSEGSISNVLNDYQAAWIGAFFTPSISSWSPKVFGFETRPSFAETSKLLCHLPPCFRAGLGWLIGGSGQSGRNFGAQFAIDDKADVEATTDELVSRGREIYEALQTISNDDDFADASERLRKNPVWGWANDADQNSSLIAERLTTVAALLRQKDETEVLLQSVPGSLSHTDFLGMELRKAWQHAALSRGKKLTPEQTSFAMQNYFDFGLRLHAGDVALLNEDKLAEKFIEAGLEPSSPDVLRLPLAARHKVWIALLLRTSEHVDVPAIFFRAVEDIEEEESKGGHYVESLHQSVLERMRKDKSFSLEHWRRYAQDRHWPSVRKMLREVALDRVRARRNGWQFDYLLFAEDDGARELLEFCITRSELLGMIKLFIEAIASKPAYADAARKWLLSLADSKIRTMGVLSSEDKLLIAMTVGGRWQSFADLWATYNNQAEHVGPSHALPTEERDILRNELDELIEQKPVRDFVPDLGGLETMLGSLPSKTATYFNKLSPTFSKREDAHKWVSAVGARDSKRASKETVRFLLESDDAAFDYWLTPEFEEKEMENLFTTLLFRQHPTRDKRYQKRLRELLTKAQGHKRVLTVVRRVFKEGIEKEGGAKIFCHRFSGDNVALEALLRCLPRTTSGMALTDAIARYDTAHFVREACDVWQTVKDREDALTAYEYAFMFYLHKRRGMRVEVERSLEEIYPGDPVELRLDEILKRDVEAGALPDAPDEREDVVEEVKVTKRRRTVEVEERESNSFWEEVKSFFGVGSAKKVRREEKTSRGNSSGRRNEIFPGLASGKTVAREDEDLPDEPHPRDL